MRSTICLWLGTFFVSLSLRRIRCFVFLSLSQWWRTESVRVWNYNARMHQCIVYICISITKLYEWHRFPFIAKKFKNTDILLRLNDKCAMYLCVYRIWCIIRNHTKFNHAPEKKARTVFFYFHLFNISRFVKVKEQLRSDTHKRTHTNVIRRCRGRGKNFAQNAETRKPVSQRRQSAHDEITLHYFQCRLWTTPNLINKTKKNK